MKFRKAFKTYEGIYALDFSLSKHAVTLAQDQKRGFTRREELEYKTRFNMNPCCLGIEEIDVASSSNSSSGGSSKLSITTNNDEDQKQQQQSGKTIVVTCSLGKSVYAWNLNQSLRYQKEEKPFLDLNSKGGSTTSSALHYVVESATASTPTLSNSQNKRKTADSVNSEGLNDNISFEFLIGFNTGDIVLYNFKTKKQILYNRDRKISAEAVSKLLWIDADTFCASTRDGNLYFYNKNYREEELFQMNPLNNSNSNSNNNTSGENNSSFSSSLSLDFRVHYGSNTQEACNPTKRLYFNSANITDISISPNGLYLAIVTSSGWCEVLDTKTSKSVATFVSHKLGSISFGGFTSCCWSPDSRVLVTSGEDDTLSIFDMKKKSIILKGVGHTGFVSKVIFDYYQCDSYKYRLISVGDDTKLLLWDLEKNNFEDQVESSNGGGGGGGGIDIHGGSNSRLSDLNVELNNNSSSSIIIDEHTEIPTIEPISIHKAHNDPVRDVKAFSTGIATVCNQGIVNFWARPILEDDSDYESQTSQEPPLSSSQQ